MFGLTSKRRADFSVNYWREEAIKARTRVEKKDEVLRVLLDSHNRINEVARAHVVEYTQNAIDTIFDKIDNLRALKIADDQIYDAVNAYLWDDIESEAVWPSE